jgi:hypothetical protein
MSSIQKVLGTLISSTSLSWFEVLGDLWKIGRKLMRGLASEGMYEVLDYESTLEILDKKGKEATFRKHMKVRYQQDEIIAFQDYAWGDGEILIDYKTSRGRAVDRHRSGHKTHILLSLREVKNKGDIDEFNISWELKNGFLTPDGYWATRVSHKMKRLKINVIFPTSRPPQRVLLEESNRRRTHILGDETRKRMSDGRWKITWETHRPKLYELYTIRWDW